MLALYRSGRQADALDVYRRLRERLIGDFGIAGGRWTADPARRPPGDPATACACRSAEGTTIGLRSRSVPGLTCDEVDGTPVACSPTRRCPCSELWSRCRASAHRAAADALVAAEVSATIVVMSLSPTWQRDGLGEARRALIRSRRPTLLLHRGPAAAERTCATCSSKCRHGSIHRAKASPR